EQVDVDAERGDDLAVVAPGADQRAYPRSGDEQVEQEPGHDGDGGDDEAIDRIGAAGNDLDRAGQEGWDAERDRLTAPDHRDRLVEEQREPKRGQHLVERPASIKR